MEVETAAWPLLGTLCHEINRQERVLILIIREKLYCNYHSKGVKTAYLECRKFSSVPLTTHMSYIKINRRL
jgi:hypothetical protein